MVLRIALPWGYFMALRRVAKVPLIQRYHGEIIGDSFSRLCFCYPFSNHIGMMNVTSVYKYTEKIYISFIVL